MALNDMQVPFIEWSESSKPKENKELTYSLEGRDHFEPDPPR